MGIRSDMDQVWDEIEIFRNMVNDLEDAVRNTQANFLVTLGVFCYCEAVGQAILYFKGDEKFTPLFFDQKDKDAPRKAFNAFFERYFSYETKSSCSKYFHNKEQNIYHSIRCGLAHHYYPENGIRINMDGDKSIEYKDGKLYIYNDKLVEEFKSALEKACCDMKKDENKWNELKIVLKNHDIYSGTGPVTISSQ